MTAQSPTDAAFNLIASLPLEDGRLWGDVAEPFQIEMVRWFLGPVSPPNRWEGRPRGGSKSTDAAACALGRLATADRPISIAVAAADRDQAGLLLGFLRGFVQRSPALSRVLDVGAWKVTATNGSQLEVLAADGPGTWGRKDDAIFVDELSAWSDTANSRQVFDALTTSMGKVPGAKMLIISMAGSPSHWSFPTYQRAHTSPRWCLGDVPGPLAWTDQEFLEDQKATLPESLYARLFLNRWVQGEDKLVRAEDLDACTILSGPSDYVPGYRYLVTADYGIVNDRTVVAVTHLERVRHADGTSSRRVSLDQLRVWKGTHANPVRLADVEAHIAVMARRFNAPCKIDPAQAISSIQNLQAMGVRADPFLFTTKSVGQLGVGLHQALRRQEIAIWPEPELRDELLNVVLRENTPGSYKIDTPAGRHDDMAVCLAMAVMHFFEEPDTTVFGRFLADLAPPCSSCATANPRGTLRCAQCNEILPQSGPEGSAVTGGRDDPTSIVIPGGPAPFLNGLKPVWHPEILPIRGLV